MMSLGDGVPPLPDIGGQNKGPGSGIVEAFGDTNVAPTILGPERQRRSLQIVISNTVINNHNKRS